MDRIDVPGKGASKRYLEIYESLPKSRTATTNRSLRDIHASMLPDELRDEFNREIANTNRLLGEKMDDYIARDRARIKWVPGDRRRGVRRRFGLAFDPHHVDIV